VSAELRERLGLLPTAELVGILEGLDAEEWRPEVFPLVEGILRERGLDVAGMAGRRREPRPAETRIPWTLSFWGSIALASLITLASSTVGFLMMAFVGLYTGGRAFPLAVGAWWVAVFAILSGLKRISRLDYGSEAFAAAMVAGQAGVFALPMVFPLSDTVFTDYELLISMATGAVIAFALVARAGRGQRQGRTP
jgi:hypothetical protein